MGRRIVVTRRIPDPALELLRAAGDVWVSPHDRPLTEPELHEAVAGADAVLTMLHDRVDDAFLDAAGPRLRVVANVAVGYDNVDVAACTARGVRFTNTPGVLTEATADIAFALILMATRRLGEGERLIRAGVPWSFSMVFHARHVDPGQDARHRRARADRHRRRPAAPARSAWTSSTAAAARPTRPSSAELGARRVDLDELLANSDVVSLHCPLTPETRHLIDAERLRQMKPTAYLVNTTRGPVVDEAALAEALRDGVIAGAGLDVFEREPEVHPDLLELENVVLAPPPRLGHHRDADGDGACWPRGTRSPCWRHRPADARELTAGGRRRCTSWAAERPGCGGSPTRSTGWCSPTTCSRPLFHDHGDHHADRLAMWLTELLGGPAEHTEHRGGFEVMKGAHQNLQITEPQRARWAELMYRASVEAGLPDEFRRRLVPYIEGGVDLRDAVSWPADRRWPR